MIACLPTKAASFLRLPGGALSISSAQGNKLQIEPTFHERPLYG